MAKHRRNRSKGSTTVEIAAPGNGQDMAPSGARVPPGSLEDEIRLRAYYRYLEREAGSSDELSDWLEAEADVLGRHATGVDEEDKILDERS